MSGVLEFSDDAGNILANVEKKTTCSDSIATVSSFNSQMKLFPIYFMPHNISV